jgi:hypothetical protein
MFLFVMMVSTSYCAVFAEVPLLLSVFEAKDRGLCFPICCSGGVFSRYVHASDHASQKEDAQGALE